MEIKEAVEALRFYQRKLYNGIPTCGLGGLTMDELKRCPFCGGEGEVRASNLYKVIDPCEHYCICGQKIDWEG